MTALTESQKHIRVLINDVVVKTVEAPEITESIDNLCTTASFTLADRPAVEPVYGDDILIQWINLDDDLVYDIFGGSIVPQDIESEPWDMTILCSDQLNLLRKIKNTSDMVFGDPDGTPAMTPDEAIKALLDYCGVTYDDADITPVAYVLGERERVSWLADGTTSAAQIVQEFNRVFRMSLFTVQNNRVIWLPYDPMPNDATGLYATYTKGTSVNFQGHHRTHGDPERVQNVWVVRGVTASLNANCTATPWARAEDGGLLVGRSRRARVATPEFQSDLIQDEELAEQIVRSLMQQTNKLPDEGTATLAFDPNVHQCSKIAIVDPTYGIGANPRYFLVRAKSATGVTMTLDLVAGPGGNEGTVTHGVDKVCTDVHTDVDWPGDFVFPDFDFPPIDLGLELDFTFPAFGFEPFDIVGGELDTLPAITCDSDAYSDALAIEADSDWQISGTLTLTNTNQRLRIGVTSDDGDYVLTIAGPGYYDGLPAEPERYEMQTPTQLRHMIGSTPLNVPITWLLRWTNATSILRCQISYGDFGVDDFAVYEAATMANAETTSTVSGTPTRASETVLHNCTEGGGGSVSFSPECWTIYDTTVGIAGTITVDATGHAYTTCNDIESVDDAPVAFTLTATVQLPDANGSVHFGVESLSGPDPNAEYEVELFGVGLAIGTFAVTAGGNYDQDTFGATGFDASEDITVVLTWNPGTSTLSCHASQAGGPDETGSVVATAGQTSAGDLHVFIEGGVGTGTVGELIDATVTL